jgi:uncharacterized protein YwgA
MTEREDIIAAVVAAAGGKITSRVRLQKVIYLLDRLGMRCGFDFDYHHYGPYSREIDSAITDAKAFSVIEEDFGRRVSDGAKYSIFTLKGEVKTEAFGKLGRKRTEKIVTLLSKTNVTVLELAATVDWLRNAEKYEDWRSEIIKRKGMKVQGGRLEKAISLLEQIKLAPSP